MTNVRCLRMDKECIPSPPMRKRRVMKRPSVIETSKLEEKLDGIVTLLQSATQVTPALSNNSNVNILSEFGLSSRAGDGVGLIGHLTATIDPNYHGNLFTPLVSSSSGLSSTSTLVNFQPAFLHPSLQPRPEDAELCLNKFRTDFVKHLPFIIIPPSVTSHQLYQEKPILWVSIMTVTCNYSTQQIALSKEFRAIIGREALVERTKNIDLLLGILVYAIW